VYVRRWTRGLRETWDSDMLTQEPMQDLLGGNMGAEAWDSRWEEWELRTTMNSRIVMIYKHVLAEENVR
jgi:hypothetical protein